jgi:Flp pilus assembly protein TadG
VPVPTLARAITRPRIDSVPTRRRESPRGQTLLEFALLLPMVVTIVIGGVDLARYVAMHTAVDGASREATRYASAVGPVGESTPRYVNCAGIRAAAQGAAPILNLSDPATMTITYQDGDGDGLPTATCPSAPSAASVHRLDRIVVTVRARFQPTLSLLPAIDIVSTDRRTIIKEPSS